MYDEARAVAAQPISGPFGGVPFLLKDLFASYAGVRLTGARGVCETAYHYPSQVAVILAAPSQAPAAGVGEKAKELTERDGLNRGVRYSAIPAASFACWGRRMDDGDSASSPDLEKVVVRSRVGDL
jgi:hypothetical protein